MPTRLPGKGPRSATYGFLPPALFLVVRDRFLERARRRLAALVPRTEAQRCDRLWGLGATARPTTPASQAPASAGRQIPVTRGHANLALPSGTPFQGSMRWSVEMLNEKVVEELNDLPLDLRARLTRLKKTQKAPRRAIRLALARGKELAR